MLFLLATWVTRPSNVGKLRCGNPRHILSKVQHSQRLHFSDVNASGYVVHTSANVLRQPTRYCRRERLASAEAQGTFTNEIKLV